MQNYRRIIYDKYASCIKRYDSKFDRNKTQQWGRAYEHYLRGWLPESKSAAILDAACGNGNLLCFLRERCYDNLTGVDISHEQVYISKQVIDNVIEMDALEFLKESESKYNLIIALDLIEHLTKDEILKFLELCFEKLEPLGRIILQTPNAVSPFVAGVFYGDFTHETLLAPECLDGILRLCGFSSIEMRETGPVIHGFISAVRYGIWKIVSLMIKLWNLIETGECDNCVFTRTFLISADKGY